MHAMCTVMRTMQWQNSVALNAAHAVATKMVRATQTTRHKMTVQRWKAKTARGIFAGCEVVWMWV